MPLTGAVVAAILSYRAALRQTGSTAASELISQLQKELSRYREDADRRATAQDERVNRLERYLDGYRSYAHQLRTHIFAGRGAPPPEWPKDLPR
ncbi:MULTISPECIES: hypothetical protein [Mycetocola]|nr:hypothetical protein [Mycetocola lacteus]